MSGTHELVVREALYDGFHGRDEPIIDESIHPGKPPKRLPEKEIVYRSAMGMLELNVDQFMPDDSWTAPDAYELVDAPPLHSLYESLL